MNKAHDIETALVKFEEAAIKHAEATERGDYKTANKSTAEIERVILFLKEHDSVEMLSRLLSHNSVGARMWAATYLLPVLEIEGMRVLKQIECETGIHSFTARMTISEWKGK